MYEIIKELTAKQNPQSVVLVHGRSKVGKTKFLRDLCQYLHRRHNFTSLIQYQNLRNLDQEGINKFIESLNGITGGCFTIQQDQTGSNVLKIQKQSSSDESSGKMLLVLDNFDNLDIRQWRRLERKLSEM